MTQWIERRSNDPWRAEMQEKIERMERELRRTYHHPRAARHPRHGQVWRADAGLAGGGKSSGYPSVVRHMVALWCVFGNTRQNRGAHELRNTLLHSHCTRAGMSTTARPGGETKYGISKRSYPAVDIKALTLDQAQVNLARLLAGQLRAHLNKNRHS